MRQNECREGVVSTLGLTLLPPLKNSLPLPGEEQKRLEEMLLDMGGGFDERIDSEINYLKEEENHEGKGKRES